MVENMQMQMDENRDEWENPITICYILFAHFDLQMQSSARWRARKGKDNIDNLIYLF